MKDRIYLNNDWQFSTEFDEKMLKTTYKKPMETVRIPHSVCSMPFNNFDESIYQMVSAYRKTFVTDKEWKGKKVILTVEAAAHFAEVFLNGKKLNIKKPIDAMNAGIGLITEDRRGSGIFGCLSVKDNVGVSVYNNNLSIFFVANKFKKRILIFWNYKRILQLMYLDEKNYKKNELYVDEDGLYRFKKGEDIFKSYPNDVVISADTIVTIDNVIISNCIN